MHPPKANQQEGASSRLTTDSQEPTWIDEIVGYLRGSSLPEDDEPAKRLTWQARRYVLVDGELYKRAANGVLLKCVTREVGHDMLVAIHEGKCGSHMSSRTLAGKAFRQGYYWPTALTDAIELV